MFESDGDDHMPVYDRQAVLAMIMWSEVIVLLLAAGWIFYAKIDLRSQLIFNVKALLLGAGAALLVTILNLLILHYANKFGEKVYLLKSMKDLINRQMLPLIGHFTFSDSVLVAVVSGLCEEIFFRGVMQSQCGLIPSACAFGLVHLPRIYYFPYALWATYVGLLMGLILNATGSLYAPVIAHALINFASITVLRRLYKTGEIGPT